MSDAPEKVQLNTRVTRAQAESLNRIAQRTGVNREAHIRLAIHAFCLAHDSIYRANQHDDQLTDEAA